MRDVFIFTIVTSAWTWCLAPRVFRVCDARCARRRFSTHTPQTVSGTQVATPSCPDDFFDALARSIRRHVPTRDALLTHLHLLQPGPMWNAFRMQLHEHIGLESIFEELRQSQDQIAQLLCLSFTQGVLVPQALDHAVQVLRNQRHAQSSLRAATAQAKLTMRILTTLPFLLLVATALASSRMRSLLVTPAAIVLVAIGVLLNRIGAWWVHVVVRRVSDTHSLPESVALVDAFCVAVQSGCTIVAACSMWDTVNPLGHRISQRIQQGDTLSAALHELTSSSHAFDAAVAHTLIAAHADGLPVVSAIAMLSAENRKMQQSHFHTAIQQLPTKLSLPLVFCVLPSFCLLVLAPLLMSQLSRFASILPSPLT